MKQTAATGALFCISEKITPLFANLLCGRRRLNQLLTPTREPVLSRLGARMLSSDAWSAISALFLAAAVVLAMRAII
jgi:hypothetical protein